MIIKSLTRKNDSFLELLIYINQGANPAHAPLLHNLHSPSSHWLSVVQEFTTNAQFCPKRKNGIRLYHEVLAFSKEDSVVLTADILADLTRHYLDLRAPGALAYARVHWEDEQHPHVHLMISANLIGSPQKLRLSRQEFNGIKRSLEAYQKDQYPELTHSIVFEPNSQSCGKRTREGPGPPNDTPLVNDRERIRSIVASAFIESNTPKQVASTLAEHGLVLYLRGNTPGVQELASGKKYRLNKLGLLPEYEAFLPDPGRSIEMSR